MYVLAVPVMHDIDPSRLTLRYLVRRAYWQGRSEVRRGQMLAGLCKEWTRYVAAGSHYLPAAGYLLAIAAGMGHELLATRGHARKTETAE